MYIGLRHSFYNSEARIITFSTLLNYNTLLKIALDSLFGLDLLWITAKPRPKN